MSGESEGENQRKPAATLTCIIVDPQSGKLSLAVREVDSKGALLDCDKEFQENEYIDAALEADDGKRHSLFAHVISSGGEGLRLRWLHFDPSEEAKLVTFLGGEVDTSAALPRKADAAKIQRSTRRVIAPKGDGAVVEDESSATNVGTDVGAKSSGSQRKTRRIIRPRTVGGDEGVTPFSGTARLSSGDSDAKKRKKAGPPVVRSRNKDSAAVELKLDDEYSPSEAKGDAAEGHGSSAARQAITGGITPGVPAKGDEAHDVVIASTARYEELSGSGSESDSESGAQRKSASETKSKTKKRMTKRSNIIGDDGRLDVGATIKSKAKSVSSSELAARHERVRVLNMRTIKHLIQDAVAEAVRHMGSSLDENEKKRLLEEAEEEFQARLQIFQAEQKGLKEQAEAYQQQLKRAEQLLEDERKRKIEADQFTVSDAGLVDMEKRFERIITRTIAKNNVGSDVEEELKALVGKLLDEEREHIAEQARKAQGDAIELLEKKVGRLAKNLESTQQERDRAHRQMEVMAAHGGGIALQNVMQAGLGDEDPDREQKLLLLKDIFDQNKSLRDEMQGAGIKIVSRRKKPQPVEAATEEASVSEAVQASPEGEAADDQAAVAESPAGDQPVARAEDEADSEESEESEDELVDPDDMPWEPGMTFRTDVEGDNEDDDDGPVKKIGAAAAIANFKPPPLLRDSAASDAAATTSDEVVADKEATESEADDNEAADDEELMNPDDMPWEPGMSFSTDIQGENEDEDDDDDGQVKKISAAAAIAKFEPPPLMPKEND